MLQLNSPKGNVTEAEAINNVAVALKYLGNGDAATTMGAIEALGAILGEKLDRLADVTYMRENDE
jgi:hypothetical protein